MNPKHDSERNTEKIAEKFAYSNCPAFGYIRNTEYEFLI